MKRNTIGVFIAVITLFSLGIISCDEDFNSVGSEVINGIGFESKTYTSKPLAYTIEAGNVQTNGLPYYYLGSFNDPTYGVSEYDFVGQVALPLSPPATNNNPTPQVPSTFDFDNVKSFDSVVLYLPYFSTVTEPANTVNKTPATYDLTNIFGNDSTTVFGLKVFRSNYFLSNFDPEQSGNGQTIGRRAYFSNDLVEFKESLEFEEISIFKTNRIDDTTVTFASQVEFKVSDKAIPNILEDGEDQDSIPDLSFLAPGLYLHLDTLKFNNFFLKESVNFPSPNNRNNFLNFFRGLYIDFEKKSEDVLFALNTNSASLNFYYKVETDSTDQQGSLSLRFNGNSINGIKETTKVEIPEADIVEGDADLFLKGGPGAYAAVELFPNRIIVDENEEAILDENGNFQFTTEDTDNSIPEIDFLQSRNWIISDARLRFFVDQETLIEQGMVEPERIFIFDLETGARLTDYCNDITPNALNHLQPLERIDEEQGLFYDINLTGYLNNLLLGNENLRALGIAVSQDVNLEVSGDGSCSPVPPREIKDSEQIITTSSVLSPLGTVLYGNTQQVPEDKRLQLTISYSQSIRE